MTKDKWLRSVALSVGALAVLIAVSGLLSCSDLLGSDGGGGGAADVDPTGTWLAVLDTPADGPTGEPFQAALAEIDNTLFTIVFYGSDTAQVAGLRGSYQVDGGSVDILVNTGWFAADPEDPLDQDAPELKETWDAIDWYEVADEDVMGLSVRIEGTTLYGGEAGEIEFEKVSFSRPLDLVNRWENGGDDVELNAGGAFTFAYYDADSDTQQDGGGPLWDACESGGRPFLRQVYDSILLDGDAMALNYKEYLCPHGMPAANTLRFYYEYDLGTDAYEDYTASEVVAADRSISKNFER